MQIKKLQNMLSKVAVATAFALCANVSMNMVYADDSLLSASAAQPDMLEFLDKHSTAPSEFETKTVKLGYNDDESALFNKESYRKESKKPVKVKPAKNIKSAVAEEKKDDEKPSMSISKGDATLTLGGVAKIEHYFQRNASFLNRNLPDEIEYFKNTFDLTTDFAYGEKRFGHKAVEAYLDVMHKGAWGKNGLITDSDVSTQLKLSETNTYFGNHTHQNGRPFVWIKEGWLRFSLNAIADVQNENIHYVKLGWFPFSLGRGISLGGFFGLNRSLLGLYSYYEEKCAPGINVGGDLVKDSLAYDLYWARFEERNRDLRSTTEVLRSNRTPQPSRTWRGLGKDNDVLAARLKIKPVHNDNGNVEIEPYIMYNSAPDQSLDVTADSDTQLGTVGLAIEQSYNNFEWGGEIAGNFGKTTVFAIDMNSTEVYPNKDGKLGERYTQVVKFDAATLGTPAAGRSKVKVDRNDAVDTAIAPAVPPIDQLTHDFPDAHVVIPGGGFEAISTKDRFRKGYENKFGGWMGVLDAAYNFKDYNTKLACGIGYASGDKDPDLVQEGKTYKGFVGLNELYSGKRVCSILVLDERKLQRPSITGISSDGTRTITDSAADMSFTDLFFGGASATLTPNVFGKKWQINPNGILFWKAYQENAPDIANDGKATMGNLKASTFMGTELNLLTKVELLKDFNLIVNLAVFIPGQYFRDFSGIDVGGKKYAKAVADDEEQDADFTKFRLAADPAFHANVGLSYKF